MSRPEIGSSRLIVPRFGIFDPTERLPDGYWASLAPGTTRVEIEIGPGDGRFLREAAHTHPATLFVGLETRIGSVSRIRRRALPPNAVVLHLDARFVVESIIADASIDAYHLYFPDPWWKKRHAKRRLVNASFAAAVTRTLRAGSALYLLTDVQTRYLEMLDVLATTPLRTEPWQRSPEDPAQSSYERKYRVQQRHIYGARLTRD